MRTLLLLTLMLILAAPHADARSPIAARQGYQLARTHAGVVQGDLTRAEAVRLYARQAHIQRVKRAYRADGTLSAWERQDLQRRLDRSSRAIAWQRHDAQRRW